MQSQNKKEKMDIKKFIFGPPKPNFNCELNLSYLKVPKEDLFLTNKPYFGNLMRVRMPEKNRLTEEMNEILEESFSFENDIFLKQSTFKIYNKTPEFFKVIWKPTNNESSYVLVFFHASGTDAFSALPLAIKIARTLGVSLIVAEYPGYGLRKKEKIVESKQLLHEAEHLIKFLIDKLGIDALNVVIAGRSLGCAPALFSALRFRVGGLVLLCPFLSIKKIVGSFSKLVKAFVKEEFPLENWIQDLKIPLLIFHGVKDKIIPISHSRELFDLVVYKKKSFVVLPEVSHNNFDCERDLAEPLGTFFKKWILRKIEHDNILIHHLPYYLAVNFKHHIEGENTFGRTISVENS